MRNYALLILLCLMAFVPGIAGLPPVDRDEPRFMQASKQMVESGDYIDIRFQNETRYKKPIGIYWMQSGVLWLSAWHTDAPAWVYRLVSVFGGIVAVCATFALGQSLFSTSSGLMAAIGLAGIFGLGFEARIAKTDAMLLASTVLAQGALGHLYLSAKMNNKPITWPVWLFWIAQAVAILIKGPILPILSLLTIVTLSAVDRDWRWLRSLRPLLGLSLVALLVAPWIAAISLKAGWEFWQDSVGKDMLGKVASGQESHGFPPGYYMLTYTLMMWPLSAIALKGGLAALSQLRVDARLRFLCAWYVPWWIMCELMPTKLPHYVLPAYPALLLIMGWSLAHPEQDKELKARWKIWFILAAQISIVSVTIGLATLTIGLPIYWNEWTMWSVGAATAFLTAGWIGVRFDSCRAPLLQIIMATAASLLAIGILSEKILPSIKELWLSREIKNSFQIHRPCPTSTLVAAGYQEPSLVFLAGTQTLLTDGRGAAGRLIADGCALAAVEADQDQDFKYAINAAGRRPQALVRLNGFNFSNGRNISVTLYRLDLVSDSIHSE